LDTGKVYRKQLGPDEYLGRIDLLSRKVYRQVPRAADEYLGRVNENGRMYLHNSLSSDDYIGKLLEPTSNAHTGAAFLLLVFPNIEVD
jgi:hypothetical protein